MWKPEHRRAADRYPNDLSDCEWALVQPMILPARRGERRRIATHDDKLARNFPAAAALIGALYWIKS